MSELIEENNRKLRYGILQEGIPEEEGMVGGDVGAGVSGSFSLAGVQRRVEGNVSQ